MSPSSRSAGMRPAHAGESMPKSSDGLRHMIMRTRGVSGSSSLLNWGTHSPLWNPSVILE
jgi:hypothetical protein